MKNDGSSKRYKLKIARLYLNGAVSQLSLKDESSLD